MRRIQQHRKEAGLSKIDTISLFIKGNKDFVSMLLKWQDRIKEKVGASAIMLSDKDPAKKHNFYKHEKVKDKEFDIFFNKN